MAEDDVENQPDALRIRRSEKLSESVARRIVDDIQARGLLEGDRLPQEAHMLESYGVARNTLREALRLLEVNGLVRVRTGPKGGPIVSGVRSDELGRMLSLYFNGYGATFRELMDARRVIEPTAARMAAERTAARTGSELSESLAAGGRHLKDASRVWFAASTGFHDVVAQLSGNRVIDLLSRALKEIYYGRLNELDMPRNESWRRKVQKSHQEIADAISRGDGDAAFDGMEAHIVDFTRRLARRNPDAYESVVHWM